MLCNCVETSFPRFLWKNRILLLHPNKKYYTQSADQEDLISIGTIGLIKGISTFDASKGARLATYAARCVENEILMYFRSQRKGAQDVSLSDCIETGRDGSALSLMDTICSEEDLFEDLSTRELHGQLRAVMEPIVDHYSDGLTVHADDHEFVTEHFTLSVLGHVCQWLTTDMSADPTILTDRIARVLNGQVRRSLELFASSPQASARA